MVDMDRFRGVGPFGRAYAYMFTHDAGAEADTVGHRIVERMVWLCAETAPALYSAPAGHEPYPPGSRPVLEALLAARLPAGPADGEATVAAVAAVCAAMAREADARPGETLDDLRLGGTEEEIAARGSSWCTDLARLGCRLVQVAGLPARLVQLADTGSPYCGHQIVEVWRGGAWGAVDPTTGVVYREADGRPATTWGLMHRPDLVVAHRRGHATPYTAPEQFRAAAISEYPWDAPGTYLVTVPNPYQRSILEMSEAGWPGGMRWLHGEEQFGIEGT